MLAAKIAASRHPGANPWINVLSAQVAAVCVSPRPIAPQGSYVYVTDIPICETDGAAVGSEIVNFVPSGELSTSMVPP